MDVRLTRAACPGRTRVQPALACGRALALLGVLGSLGMLGCASKESAAPTPAAPAPASTAASETAPPGEKPEEATEEVAGEAVGTAAPPPAPAPTPTPTPIEPSVPTEPAPPAPRVGATPPLPEKPMPGRKPQRDRAGPAPTETGPDQRPRPGRKPQQAKDGPASPTPVTAPPQQPEEQQAAERPAAGPAPEHDVRELRDDIEAFYASLPEEAIAFHVPRAVPRGQVFTVRLIVAPGKSEAEIERVLVEMARDAGPGEVRTRTARVGDEMQALLSSPTLQIAVRGSDTQLVRRSGVTEWVWDVTATAGGTHRLSLALYAIPQGRGSGLKVKTFEETLTVKVGFVDEVKETFLANWEWLWTFLLGPIGAAAWRRRQRRSARAPSDGAGGDTAAPRQ